MATTKKPAATAPAKAVPTVSSKPAVKPAAAAKSAAAKPAAKKAVAAPVAKKAVAKVETKPTPAPVAEKAAAPVAKAKAPAKKKVVAEVKTIDPGQRANYIEVAAFYIAERRGFTPGNPEQDYLDAAAEIDRLIAAGQFGK
jgi:hypothetical protein